MQCKSPLLKKHSIRFCSQSCSAAFNNTHRDHKIRDKQRTTLIETLVEKGLNRTDEKEIYKAQCAFKFNVYDYPNMPGYNLLLEKGFVNHVTNKDGAARDHIISKEYGWRNNIPPHIISHPANCQLISNMENVKKGADCYLSYEDLIQRIALWDATQDTSVVLKPVAQKSRKHDEVKNKKDSHKLYKWILKHADTGALVEVDKIGRWLKSNGLSTTSIYGKNPKWIIQEKHCLRTDTRLI